jgi:hypothetical protein
LRRSGRRIALQKRRFSRRRPVGLAFDQKQATNVRSCVFVNVAARTHLSEAATKATPIQSKIVREQTASFNARIVRLRYNEPFPFQQFFES